MICEFTPADGPEGIALMRLSGAATESECREALATLAHAGHSGGAGLVTDISDLENPEVLLRMFLQGSERSAFSPGFPRALVVGRQGAAVARVWSDVTRLAGHTTAVFETEDEALDWLAGPSSA